MQPSPTTPATLAERFGESVTLHTPEPDPKLGGQGDAWIEVAPEVFRDVVLFLHGEEKYDYLNNLTVVDFLPIDKKTAKAVGEPRLEVVYHLSSLARKEQLTLKVTLPRWKEGTESELPEIASVADLWQTAIWHEREAYDLSGVHFTGHPKLERILCPEDWTGHPLRKDYEMPLEYQGIRGR